MGSDRGRIGGALTGRVWFPGCGLDPYPHTYAERGYTVFATDFSSVAVGYQQRLAAA